MAGWEGHVIYVGHIPGADEVSSAVWFGFDLMDEVFDLVDFSSFSIGPVSPLVAVDRAKVSILIRPLVPNRTPIFFQPGDIGLTSQKPK